MFDEPRYELKDCPTCHRVRYMRWARTKGVWRCYGCRGGFAPTAFTDACDYGDLPGDNPNPDPWSERALWAWMGSEITTRSLLRASRKSTTMA